MAEKAIAHTALKAPTEGRNGGGAGVAGDLKLFIFPQC